MNDKTGSITLKGRESLWEGFVRMERLTVEQTVADGRAVTLQREVHDHGHGAAILLYDAARRIVVLVRQFRAGAFAAGEAPLLLEVPAGLIEGDHPEEAIRREAIEETGFFVEQAHYLFDAFASPGTLTEKIAFFFAFVSATDRVTDGGGLDDEHEFIEVVELPLDEAFALIRTGGIRDLKTVTLLQWAMLNRTALDECTVPV